MASGDGAVGVVFNFDGGNLTSAISAMRQQLVQLGYIYQQVVLHAVASAESMQSLIESFDSELSALDRWENEGGR